MMIIRRSEYVVLMTLAVLIILSILFFIFTILYPYKTITYENEVFPVIKKEIKQGEYIEYIVDYCRYTDVEVEVIRELVDGVIFTLPTVKSRFPKGCHKRTVSRLQVSPHIPPGEYYLLLTVKIPVFPWRTDVKTVRTEKFNIIP